MGVERRGQVQHRASRDDTDVGPTPEVTEAEGSDGGNQGHRDSPAQEMRSPAWKKVPTGPESVPKNLPAARGSRKGSGRFRESRFAMQCAAHPGTETVLRCGK